MSIHTEGEAGSDLNRPISVYCFPRRALTLCPQLCMGIQPDACSPALSADALPAILYGHFTPAIYRNRPIDCLVLNDPPEGCYIEFAERLPLPEFAHVAAAGGVLREVGTSQ